MKRIIINSCVGVLLIFLIIDKVNSEPLQLYNKSNLPITIPEGWVEVPSSILAARAEKVAKLSPNLPKQNFDYAFQLETAEMWFDPPYVMIQVNKTGRIPLKDLKNLDKFAPNNKYKGTKKQVQGEYVQYTVWETIL